jgi:hypothetical protein
MFQTTNQIWMNGNISRTWMLKTIKSLQIPFHEITIISDHSPINFPFNPMFNLSPFNPINFPFNSVPLNCHNHWATPPWTFGQMHANAILNLVGSNHPGRKQKNQSGFINPVLILMMIWPGNAVKLWWFKVI